MRIPNFYRGRDDGLDVTMTPMIDVVFLLLIFFVWTTSFQIIEYILPSRMSAQIGDQATPLVDPPPEKDFDNVVIRIGWDGQSVSLAVNDVPASSMDQVVTQLRQIANVKLDAPIILHPQPAVPLGYVIEVYDVVKLVGFQKVSFAVNPT